MKYDEGSNLDLSGVQDRRGGVGGKGIAIGGGGVGIVGVIIYVLVSVLGGSGGDSQAITSVLGGLGSGQTADNSELASECRTGADANDNRDCAVVADIDSIQDYWNTALPKLGTAYADVPTVFFSGSTATACGQADSGTGPFYCPGDQRVYIDLSFYDELQTTFGAEGGLFVDAYVIAHEYGHHVQDLLGTEAKVRAGETGPTSGSVRLELQADCYAGVWAKNATTTPTDSGRPLITEITADDVDRALDAASRIGDDYIQTQVSGGTNNPGAYTHGTSAQRKKWFSAGYRSGNPASCDTFGATSL